MHLATSGITDLKNIRTQAAKSSTGRFRSSPDFLHRDKEGGAEGEEEGKRPYTRIVIPSFCN
jgi:hypothetical protein